MASASLCASLVSLAQVGELVLIELRPCQLRECGRFRGLFIHIGVPTRGETSNEAARPAPRDVRWIIGRQ